MLGGDGGSQVWITLPPQPEVNSLKVVKSQQELGKPRRRPPVVGWLKIAHDISAYCRHYKRGPSTAGAISISFDSEQQASNNKHIEPEAGLQ